MRCMIEYLHWNLEGAPLSKKCYRAIVLQPYACDATRTTNHSDSPASPSPPVELFYPFVQWSIQAGGRARAGGGRGRNEDEWLELPRERKGATCFLAGPTAVVSEKKKRKEGGRADANIFLPAGETHKDPFCRILVTAVICPRRLLSLFV